MKKKLLVIVLLIVAVIVLVLAQMKTDTQCLVDCLSLQGSTQDACWSYCEGE